MLRFQTQYELVPWGGRRLEQEFGRDLPTGPVGEAWELVDLGERQSTVTEGESAEQSLHTLWQTGILGGSAQGDFPFLLKWLDTKEYLSVQVHPDAAACEQLGQGHSKSEAWYVAHADPGAMLLLGHYPGLDAQTLKQAAQTGTIQKWLYEISPRVGDMLFVPAGTLHAIGGGFLLLEVQQPSDTTYRIFDWNRVGLDGKLRDLHLDEASVAVNFEKFGAPKASQLEVNGPCFSMRVIRPGEEVSAECLRVIVAHTASVKLTTEKSELQLEYGDVGVAELADGKLRVKDTPCILISEA